MPTVSSNINNTNLTIDNGGARKVELKLISNTTKTLDITQYPNIIINKVTDIDCGIIM